MLFSSRVRVKIRVKIMYSDYIKCLVGKLLCTRICSTLGSNCYTAGYFKPEQLNCRDISIKLQTAALHITGLR